MDLKIEINMDNAAFEDNPNELARILKEYAARLELGDDKDSVLRDGNGNKVGFAALEGE